MFHSEIVLVSLMHVNKCMERGYIVEILHYDKLITKY
jgi:hypothetical protein